MFWCSEQVTGAQPAQAKFLSFFGGLTLRSDFEKSLMEAVNDKTI